MSSARIATLDKLLEYIDTYDDTAVPSLAAYLKLEQITTVHPRYLQQMARLLVFMSRSGVAFNYSGHLSSLRRLYKRSPVWLGSYQELLSRGLLVEQGAIRGVDVTTTQALSHLIDSLGVSS
jgi:hypothetical protein